MATGRRAEAAPFSLLAAAAWLFVTVASARPGTGGECTSALVSLSPCVDYISGSDKTAPSRCCSQLMSMARSKPQCLCAALGVDRTRALNLATACDVQAWHAGECYGERRMETLSIRGPEATATTMQLPYVASGGAPLRGPARWLRSTLSTA